MEATNKNNHNCLHCARHNNTSSYDPRKQPHSPQSFCLRTAKQKFDTTDRLKNPCLSSWARTRVLYWFGAYVIIQNKRSTEHVSVLYEVLIQDDQKVSVHLTITVQCTIDELKMAITEYIRNVDRAILNTVFENTVRCVNKCLETGGGHFEYYL